MKIKIFNSICSLMVVVLLTFVVITEIFPNQVSAESILNPYANNYNIVDAANYGIKWYNSENPDYKSIDGFAYDKKVNKHCASFVSQCLTAGGIEIPKVKRKLNGLHYKYENICWSNANEQYKYLKDLGYLSEEARDDNIHIGDVVYYDWKSDGYGEINHATFCVGMNSVGEPIIVEHSNCNIGVWDNRGDEFKAYVVHMTNALGHKDVTNEYIDSSINIKSLKNKYYVSSDTDDSSAGSTIAIANRISADTWETFKVVENKSLPTILDVRYNGVPLTSGMTPAISLKTNTGKYLSSYISESDAPLKNTENISTWEAFRIFRTGDTEYLLSLINGKFVQVRDNNKLYASGQAGFSWESFDIIRSDSNNVSSISNNTYTITATSGVKVRTNSGISASQVGGLAKGSIVTYDKTETKEGYTWYHIVSVDAKNGSWGEYTGNWVAGT
ncbi:MAG: amidase domain-containing protein [Ruminococcus flavefaciens]|nr:amidase domain-containing protein [Ruminococcus flavefaciens]